MNGTRLSVETIRGWSRAALDLNALDHCLPPAEAGAPGPCASSYAMGLAYAAMADGCAHALGSYAPAIATTAPNGDPVDVDRFVGGAVFGVLSGIFRADEHQQLLRDATGALPNGGEDWDRGIAFSVQLLEIWRRARVAERVAPMPLYYERVPGKHNEDPLNMGQGFYGQAWAGGTGSVTLPAELRPSVSPLGLNPDDLEAAYQPLVSPPSETSQQFLNSAVEVKEVGRLPVDVEDNGPQGPQLTIGTFWAYDGAANIGTPPRLYTQLVEQIIDERGGIGDAPELARLLALCNVAMANASIVAWRGKYEHAIARPILWIRTAKSEIQDGNWEPLGSPRSTRQSQYCVPQPLGTAQAFVAGTMDPDKFTPNFPAYPSGHATFGGACFRVLELYLGTNELGSKGGTVELSSEELDGGTTDPFTEEPRRGRTVAFRTTEDLVEANSYSRILLGVHWDFDGTDGNAAGRIVGQRTFEALYR